MTQRNLRALGAGLALLMLSSAVIALSALYVAIKQPPDTSAEVYAMAVVAAPVFAALCLTSILAGIAVAGMHPTDETPRSASKSS